MDEGLYGLLDFVGFPVGSERAAPPGQPAGFYGLLDFTGIPVGAPTFIRGGSTFVGGWRRYLLEEAIQRSARERTTRSLLTELLNRGAQLHLANQLRYAEFQFQKQQMVDRMVTATLLAEL